MDSPGLTLTINIAETGSDAEQLDDLTRHLQRDLYDLGVEEAERPPGSLTPVGAKGDPLSIGALALVAVPAVLPNVVSLLQSWVLRGQGRTVRIKTPAGLEVEFESEHRLSQDEILALVGRLEAGPRAAVDPLPETRKEDSL
ncbi:MAG TPA: hypothetical protein VJ768_01835, partial [Anaerolineales bacterium]|nr:hypothetical protein [Anaerolineales bacterium]